MSQAPTQAARVAIVTGAGRRGGIGLAIARQLLSDGCAVVVSDLERPMSSHPDYQGARRDELAIAAGELAGLGIGAVATCGCDVQNSDEAERLVAFAVERFGRLDVMVNNAGVAIGLGPVVELTDADWKVNLDVMATGVFNCSRAAARRMIEQGEGGRIITIASQAGKLGQPWLGAYCAAKFAAVGLTQVMAHELGPHGITVNAVCPGTVLTPLLDVRGGIFDVYPARAGITREQYERRVLRTIPLRRFQTPEDVASAVGFLASSQGGYITGEAMNVSGGQTMA
ncbi:MAG TPA: SDR family oxidoreductase [Solirubrobacteraceae bacterium]|nr:SDR family oxidoreductase [Solirubrobacteraceae bacterium]